MYTTKLASRAALTLSALFFGSILLTFAETAGDVLVYSFSDGSGTQLRAIDLRTHQNLVLLKIDNPLAPAWSPSGCQIAYYARSNSLLSELRLLSFAEGHSVTIYDQSVSSFDASEPDWSPDGSQLVFVGGDRGLYTLRLSDTKTTRLTAGRQNVTSPRWSPEGGKIVFEGLSDLFDTNAEQKRATEIYTINVQGGSVTDLSNNHAQDTEPVWSPDSAQIAFVSNRYGGSGDIFIMSSNGTGVRQIAQIGQVADLSWSPDGKRLAFALNTNGGWNLYVMNLDGTGLERVTFDQPPSYSREPDWQPQLCSRN